MLPVRVDTGGKESHCPGVAKPDDVSSMAFVNEFGRIGIDGGQRGQTDTGLAVSAEQVGNKKAPCSEGLSINAGVD